MQNRGLITCSTQEFVFIAGMLGAQSVVGIRDPFEGWLAAEIEDAWIRAREAMVRRNLLLVRSDGSVYVESGTASVVGACSFPEASVIVTHTPAQGEACAYGFHLFDGRIVRLTAPLVPNAACSLELVSTDVKHLHDLVAGILSLDGATPCAEGGELPEAVLLEARNQAGQAGEGAARAALLSGGLSAGVATALAASLRRPISNYAIALITQAAGPVEPRGIGLLQAENGLWRFTSAEREGQTWVQISPSTMKDARLELQRVLHDAFPSVVKSA